MFYIQLTCIIFYLLKQCLPTFFPWGPFCPVSKTSLDAPTTSPTHTVKLINYKLLLCKKIHSSCRVLLVILLVLNSRLYRQFLFVFYKCNIYIYIIFVTSQPLHRQNCDFWGSLHGVLVPRFGSTDLKFPVVAWPLSDNKTLIKKTIKSISKAFASVLSFHLIGNSNI